MHILTLHKCPFSFLSSCSSIFFRNCAVSNSSMKENSTLVVEDKDIYVMVELKNDRYMQFIVILVIFNLYTFLSSSIRLHSVNKYIKIARIMLISTPLIRYEIILFIISNAITISFFLLSIILFFFCSDHKL